MSMRQARFPVPVLEPGQVGSAGTGSLALGRPARPVRSAVAKGRGGGVLFGPVRGRLQGGREHGGRTGLPRVTRGSAGPKRRFRKGKALGRPDGQVTAHASARAEIWRPAPGVESQAARKHSFLPHPCVQVACQRRLGKSLQLNILQSRVKCQKGRWCVNRGGRKN